MNVLITISSTALALYGDKDGAAPYRSHTTGDFQMRKLSTLAMIAGLVTALVTTGAQAQQVPGGPTHQPQQSSASSEPDCTELMGFMRSIKQAEIRAFNGERVRLIPVCEDGTHRTRNAYGTLFRDGNAELLRLPIAQHPQLLSTLKARDYDQHDVVSVRFSANNGIILYVHQRDMR